MRETTNHEKQAETRRTESGCLAVVPLVMELFHINRRPAHAADPASGESEETKGGEVMGDDYSWLFGFLQDKLPIWAEMHTGGPDEAARCIEALEQIKSAIAAERAAWQRERDGWQEAWVAWDDSEDSDAAIEVANGEQLYFSEEECEDYCDELGTHSPRKILVRFAKQPGEMT